MGEDKPALYYIYSPDQETMLKAGFVEDHPCLWVKVLADEEYNEIITILNQMMDWLDNFQFVKLKNMNNPASVSMLSGLRKPQIRF